MKPSSKKRIKAFVRENIRRDVGWYLIPRAFYFTKERLKLLHKFMLWMKKEQFVRVKDIPPEQKQKYYTLFEKPDPNTLVLREWTTPVKERFLKRMVSSGLIKPYAKDQTVQDQLANLRNYINLLKKLGFAYFNKSKHLFISPVGEEFCKADNQIKWEKIFQKQLLRLQFWNPSLRKRDIKTYRQYHIFPYLFALEVISKLKKAQITNDELALFLVYAKTPKDINLIIGLIEGYRKLSAKDQREVKGLIPKQKRYPKVVQARLTQQLFSLTPPLSLSKGVLSVEDKNEIKKLISFYKPKLHFVAYRAFEDWYHYIGDTEIEFPIEEVAKYYFEVERIEKKENVPKIIPKEIREAPTFQEIVEQMIDEQALESALEKKISVIEKGLKLIKNGRQYPTEVGPIDLLARDRKRRYVVVELKKGRSSDKVMGQTLRYMGWVRINLSPSQIVRGIIVGRPITEKLKYAREGLQHLMKDIIVLKEFTLPDFKAAKIKNTHL